MMETNPSICDLPEDLYPDILSRLPVKSLLRFRCVSKSWLAMVDDAKFARSHLNNFVNNREETRFFVVHTPSDFPQRDSDIPQRDCECEVRRTHTFEVIPETVLSILNGRWYVLSSVDGLILLKCLEEKRSKVWNPSTRKCREIPPLVHRIQGDWIDEVDIGLGYDSLADDYKLVRLVFLDRIVHSVAIYSLGSNSWRMVKFQCKGYSCIRTRLQIDDLSGSICFQGCLYFVAEGENTLIGDLVSFDFSNEVFSCISLPAFNSQDELIMVKSGCSFVIDDCSPESLVWELDWESMGWKKHCSWSSYVENNEYEKLRKELYTGRLPSWRYVMNVSRYVESLILP